MRHAACYGRHARWGGCTGGCTRGSGYGVMVRTLVGTRGMGPGLPHPRFYRVFSENGKFHNFQWFSWFSCFLTEFRIDVSSCGVWLCFWILHFLHFLSFSGNSSLKRGSFWRFSREVTVVSLVVSRVVSIMDPFSVHKRVHYWQLVSKSLSKPRGYCIFVKNSDFHEKQWKTTKTVIFSKTPIQT